MKQSNSSYKKRKKDYLAGITIEFSLNLNMDEHAIIIKIIKLRKVPYDVHVLDVSLILSIKILATFT